MKKWTTTAIAAALMVSTAATSFASLQTTYSGTLTGDNTVKNPIYSYQIPKDVAFAIDAFQKVEENGQIFSPDFAIINKSDVALRANITPTVTPASGTTIKAAPGQVSQASGTPTTNKQACLEFVPADSASILTEEGVAAAPDVAMPVKTAGTSDVVTPAEGTASDAAKFSFTNTHVFTAAEGAKLDLVITKTVTTGGSVVSEFARVSSDALPSTFASTAEGTAAVFDGKTFMVPHPTIAGKNHYFKINGTAATVVANEVDSEGNAIAAAVTTYGFATGATYAARVEPSIGTPATAKMDAATPASYSEYNNTTGSANADKIALAATGANDPSITFALSKATYAKNFVDETDPSLIQTIPADTSAAVYRLFGTVNANQTWAAADLEVSLKFDVTGLTKSAYDTKRATLGTGMNVLSSAVEPAFGTGSGNVPTTFACTSAAGLKYTFVNGSKESLLVNTANPGEGFTASFQVAGEEPIDVTSAGTLAVVTNVPNITFEKTAFGALLTPYKAQIEAKAGKGVMTFTFTGSDGYVTTLTSPEITITAIPAA